MSEEIGSREKTIRKNLAESLGKNLPAIYESPPQDANARAFASTIRKAIEQKERVPATTARWLQIYESVKDKRKSVSVNVVVEEEEHESQRGVTIPPSAVDLSSGVPSGLADGPERGGVLDGFTTAQISEVHVRGISDLVKHVGDMQKHAMTEIRYIIDVERKDAGENARHAMQQIREAHKESEQNLIASNRQLLEANKFLLEFVTRFGELSREQFKLAGKLSKKHRKALLAQLEAVAPTVPAEEKDLFDKVIASVQAGSILATPVAIGVMSKFGIELPKEILEALGKIIESNKPEEKEEEEDE